MSKKIRLLKMGLQTLLGLKKQGVFMPYRYAHKTPVVSADICYSHIKDKMQTRHEAFENTIKQTQTFLPAFEALPPSSLSPAPRFEQFWFPRLDAMVAYNMVRQHSPQKIIEIGCGHSTRFIAGALQDGDIACDFTAIDPSPRATLPASVKHICDYVQNIPPSQLTALQKNDILFMDSSHLLYSGSDVDFLLNGILPLLKSGVLIHIHDIFLPYDYPTHWHWRGYNEQSAVAALLVGGGAGRGFEILWSSVYAVHHLSSVLQKSGLLDIPILPDAHETSLWLRKI